MYLLFILSLIYFFSNLFLTMMFFMKRGFNKDEVRFIYDWIFFIILCFFATLMAVGVGINAIVKIVFFNKNDKNVKQDEKSNVSDNSNVDEFNRTRAKLIEDAKAKIKDNTSLNSSEKEELISKLDRYGNTPLGI